MLLSNASQYDPLPTRSIAMRHKNIQSAPTKVYARQAALQRVGLLALAATRCGCCLACTPLLLLQDVANTG